MLDQLNTQNIEEFNKIQSLVTKCNRMDEQISGHPSFNITDHVTLDYWLIGGNEPPLPPIAECKGNKNGRFALFGCGVLKSIEAAFCLTNQDVYFNQNDPEVPRLFILDRSYAVGIAWFNLKLLVSQHKTLGDFVNGISKETDLFECLSPYDLNSARHYFIQTVITFCKHDAHYHLFKKIIEAAFISLGRWDELSDVQELQSKLPLDMPVYVYLSNIMEYRIVVDEDVSEPLKSIQVKNLIDNVLSLKPELTFITLTTQTFFEQYQVIHPNCARVIHDHTFEGLLNGFKSLSMHSIEDYLERLPLPMLNASIVEQSSQLNYTPQYQMNLNDSKTSTCPNSEELSTDRNLPRSTGILTHLT